MIDFPPVPDWQLPDGTVTKLGNHTPPVRVFRVMGKLPDIPDSELKEFDLRTNPHFKVKVKNQGSFGACNGFAAATSLEIARFLAGGLHVNLSPWLIYADLCNGFDRGSIIADALKHLKVKGTCPEDMVPHGTINPRRVSADARAESHRFKIELGYEINSHRDLVVATHLRYAINFSVPVNGSFNALDSEGVPGNRAGIHNHAVTCGLGLKRSSKYGWLALSQNSWGEAWGQKGYFWSAEKTVSGSYSDAYCVSAIISDPMDPMPPIDDKALTGVNR